MTPAISAAVCVSLAMGRNRADIMAAAVRNAIAAYKAKQGRIAP